MTPEKTEAIAFAKRARSWMREHYDLSDVQILEHFAAVTAIPNEAVRIPQSPSPRRRQGEGAA